MTWRRAPRLAWVTPEDEETDGTWVLNADQNAIFAFSDVAFLVWEAADGAHSITEVVDSLVETCGWDREGIADAVDQFVRVLVHQEFLEEVSA